MADRLYGTRDYGAAVMYLPGKILYAGGGRTTATAETIDLNKSPPAWKWTGSMAYPRRHLNATMLPTGEVLVTGGTQRDQLQRPEPGACAWRRSGIRPRGAWTQLASNAVNRGLPRDLGPAARRPGAARRERRRGWPDGNPYPDEKNGELYSPPYLFKGARPTITSAPVRRATAARITVKTPNAGRITKVSLIAIGSVTHAFDSNQRFMWLDVHPHQHRGQREGAGQPGTPRRPATTCCSS